MESPQLSNKVISNTCVTTQIRDSSNYQHSSTLANPFSRSESETNNYENFRLQAVHKNVSSRFYFFFFRPSRLTVCLSVRYTQKAKKSCRQSFQTLRLPQIHVDSKRFPFHRRWNRPSTVATMDEGVHRGRAWRWHGHFSFFIFKTMNERA
jgi:hypothetical protein